jgi:hypothetical protein
MPKRKRLLINMIDSIGAVEEGDNSTAQMLFYKRATPEQVVVEELSENRPTVEPKKGARMADIDLSVLDEDTQAAFVALTAERDEALAKVAELEVEAVALTEIAAEDEADGVEKASPELVAKLRDELAQTAEALAKELGDRRVREWISKAEPFKDMLGNADEVGPVLEQIDRAVPEAAEKMVQWLTAASQRVDMAKLFAEAGNAGSETDPLSKQAEYVKAHPELEPSIAKSRFWIENPDAVAALREEA